MIGTGRGEPRVFSPSKSYDVPSSSRYQKLGSRDREIQSRFQSSASSEPARYVEFSNLKFFYTSALFLETYFSPFELFIVRVLPMFFNEPCDISLSIQLSYKYFPPGKTSFEYLMYSR